MKIFGFTPLIRLQPGGAPLPSATEKGLPVHLQLDPGQLLKARIISLLPGGRTLIDIQGQQLAAETRVQFSPGQEVWLEVKQSGDSLWLGIASKKGAARELLGQLLGNNNVLSEFIATLSTVTTAAPETLSKDQQALFNLLFRNIGQTAVAEKPAVENLLKTIAFLNEDGIGSNLFGSNLSGGGNDDLPLAMKKLTGLLQLHSQLNNLPADQNQSPSYLFPCFFAQGAGLGEWLFSCDRDSQENTTGEGGYSVNFFLTMSRLGEVRIQARVLPDTELSGEFTLTEEKACDHMQKNLPELRALLEALGYQAVHLRCRQSTTPLAAELKKHLLDTGSARPFTILDIKA